MARVQSLVGELRSRKLHGTAKRKRKKFLRIRFLVLKGSFLPLLCLLWALGQYEPAARGRTPSADGREGLGYALDILPLTLAWSWAEGHLSSAV